MYADDLISMTKDGQTYYYHFNGLGSTQMLSDSNGVITDSFDYDAFGKQIARTGKTENSFLFAGQQYDVDAGLYYLRARYYQSEMGRFTTSDKWNGLDNMPLTLQKYLYVNGNPINRTDPSGYTDLITLSYTITLFNTLINTSKTTSNLQIPVLPSALERRQLVGIIYAESAGDNAQQQTTEDPYEKSAIGATVLNRAYYATLTPAHGQCYNQDFGSGSFISAIAMDGQFKAYGRARWNQVMNGNDLKSPDELQKILPVKDRLHLINSVSAAEGLSSSAQMVAIGTLGGRLPVAFNKAQDSPPSDRMEKIGRLNNVHTFYGFIEGQECE